MLTLFVSELTANHNTDVVYYICPFVKHFTFSAGVAVPYIP